MRTICFFLLFLPVLVLAQPSGYYNPALGLNGPALRAALHNIIDSHSTLGYAALWLQFPATDAKASGKVWDIYSDRPGQTPPYEYTFVTDQCGNYNSEGDCYNREHTYPQSYFNSAEPMRSDLFQVYPTDGYVNGKRSDFMYGEVSNPNYTSLNGSQTGPNSYPGAPSGTCFEPVDSFKGDLARTYFYIATRYQGEDIGWSDWEMAKGAELKTWAVSMLLEWHQNDPVSQKEIDRNNAIYAVQNNRNPFIDQPVFADCIWGTADCSGLDVPVSDPQQAWCLYPNPATERVRVAVVTSGSGAFTVTVTDMQGRPVWQKHGTMAETLDVMVKDWAAGVYLVQVRTGKMVTMQRLVVQ